MKKYGYITSEYVGRGHPDKLADAISDTIVDLYIAKDSTSRVAVETLVKDENVVLGGEVLSNAHVFHDEIVDAVKRTIKEIGYNYEPKVTNLIGQQSPDITQGTNDEVGGAGDQGIMFGYAINDTKDFMPLEHQIAKEIVRSIEKNFYGVYGPDMKSQVTCEYNQQDKPKLHTIVVAVQHPDDVDSLKLQKDIGEIITKVLAEYKEVLVVDKYNLYINATGRFVIGGPFGDSGVTGRKIVVDNYGANSPVGGGAYSSKDPTKVDRSAAYMARYIAKNIVYSKLADECLVQLAYCIGIAKPISFKLEMIKDSKPVDEKVSDRLVEKINNFLDLSPKGIIEFLDLRKPIYKETVLKGHFGFGAEEFTWEKIDQNFQKVLEEVKGE